MVTDAARRGPRVAAPRAECGPDSAKRSGLLSPARGVPVGVVMLVSRLIAAGGCYPSPGTLAEFLASQGIQSTPSAEPTPVASKEIGPER